MPAARRTQRSAQRPKRPRAIHRSRGPRRAKKERRGSPWLRRLVWFSLLGLVGGAALFFATLPSVGDLGRKMPATTALMEARAAQKRAAGRTERRSFAPVRLPAISRWLREAVVDSEDARFYDHHGIDLVETGTALGDAFSEGHLGRGASTLTQQLAKNLWLGEERSVLRKAREAALALRLESLGKERILELYLNVVEWGDGIYGAEAAARHWFGLSAAQLQPEHAAVLAAMLPAPRKRSPRHPSRKLKQRAERVLSLFAEYGQLDAAGLVAARGRLAGLWGGGP